MNSVICVGSSNSMKLLAVKAAAKSFSVFLGATFYSTSVESGVSPQPNGFLETFEGAKNRANAALNVSLSYDSEIAVGVGLENGLGYFGSPSGLINEPLEDIADVDMIKDPTASNAFDFSAAHVIAVHKKQRTEGRGFGPGIPLPMWAFVAANASELKNVLETDDSTLALTKGLLTRVEALRLAALGAFIEALELFEGPNEKEYKKKIRSSDVSRVVPSWGPDALTSSMTRSGRESIYETLNSVVKR